MPMDMASDPLVVRQVSYAERVSPLAEPVEAYHLASTGSANDHHFTPDGLLALTISSLRHGGCGNLS